MPSRISSGGMSSTINPFGPQWPKATEGAKEARPVGDQVEEALFGKRKPPVLDEDDFPEVTEILALLDKYRKKFAVMVGDQEKDYRLQLADGTLAMIDGHGTIFIGVRFLLKFQKNPSVLIGALAHEVGHRPHRWAEYKTKKDLNREEINELCRFEETRADLFAGRAMAEVNISPEPMIQFLEEIEEGPHPDYFPAKMRADVIREGYNEQKSKVNNRKKMWPELDRATAARLHLGDF